jgi:hypothetical protein
MNMNVSTVILDQNTNEASYVLPPTQLNWKPVPNVCEAGEKSQDIRNAQELYDAGVLNHSFKCQSRKQNHRNTVVSVRFMT